MKNIPLELLSFFNTQKRYSFPFNPYKKEIPKNGIYIIFEKGEQFNNLDRIVRVGTHTGENQLHARLKQHFIKENKNRSIFRKNIGRCLLNKTHNPYLINWELDITSKIDRERNTSLIDFELEKALEKEISNYIQTNFTFSLFNVVTKEERLFWESKIVSTLAKEDKFKPSDNWLGHFSPKDKIRISGLWQVNELYTESLSENEFNQLIQQINNQKHV
jgi:hypothetical protein